MIPPLRLLLVLPTFAIICGGPTDLLSDPLFEAWCDDGPCDWEIEEGQVLPETLWHPEEVGPRLRGDPVRLSTLSGVTSEQATCLQFTVAAQREGRANLDILLDFNDDGEVEQTHAATVDDFEPYTWFAAAPETYEGLRVTLVKTGPDDMIIGQARLQEARAVDCETPDTL
jgi:hypothetical protein